jgi:hypothetical protein
MLEEEILWKKPDRDQVKINMDGAFGEPLGIGAWGFTTRYDRCEFVAAVVGNSDTCVLRYRLRPKHLLQ